jgi:hypothetical protein
MSAILFGSISPIADISELQRQAFRLVDSIGVGIGQRI